VDLADMQKSLHAASNKATTMQHDHLRAGGACGFTSRWVRCIQRGELKPLELKPLFKKMRRDSIVFLPSPVWGEGLGW